MAPPQITLSFPQHLGLDSITLQTGLFINNQFVEASNHKTFETINPSTGKSIGHVSEAQAEDIDRASQVARKAFETTWGQQVAGHERAKMLWALADLVEKHQNNFAAIETLDNGKTYEMAQMDIAGVIRWFRYYAGWADKDLGQTIQPDPSKMVYTIHEPIGVVGQIIPWNFPLLMAAWKIAPALATGNTVILKPAEQTPLSALYLCTFIAQVFPPGVINVTPGLGSVAGNAIVEHPSIDKIAFTGSTTVGKAIAQIAAKTNLKKVSLELGGKSPNLVFEDADLEQAVKWTGFGIFFNHGQCCSAGSRIYVQESIYDKFLDELVKHAQSLKVGDPFDNSTFQGPQITQAQFDRIMGYIDSGRQEGAKCLLGGKRVGKEGYFIEPTIFTDIKSDMKIVKEEIFGPVVSIGKFKTEEEAIEVANHSMYGLAAGIHTENLTRAIRVSGKLKAGTIWVNCYNRLYPDVPFGGYKESGIGRENGKYALDNYTAVKAVQINLSERI